MNKRLLIFGNSITWLGDIVFEYALKIWIVTTFNNPAFLAIVSSFENIISVVSNIIGGIIADRYNRKKILIICDFTSAAVCAILFLMQINTMLTLLSVVVINSILTIIYSAYSPASKSIVPDAVTEDELVSLNSILNGISELSKIIGPLIASVLMFLFKFEGAILINCISYLISGLAEMRIEINNSNKVEKNDKLNILKEFKDAYRYLMEDRKIFYMLVLISFVNLFLAGYNLVLPFIFSSTKIYTINYYLNSALTRFIVTLHQICEKFKFRSLYFTIKKLSFEQFIYFFCNDIFS